MRYTNGRVYFTLLYFALITKYSNLMANNFISLISFKLYGVKLNTVTTQELRLPAWLT